MEHPIYTRSRQLSPIKLIGTKCDRASIASGSVINAEEIVQSVVGIRSRIGKGSKVFRSIVMGKDVYEDVQALREQGIIPMGIGRNCHIENAIIDINCRIGDDVTIIGDDSLPDMETDLYCIIDGIVVLKKSVTVPNGMKIGLNA